MFDCRDSWLGNNAWGHGGLLQRRGESPRDEIREVRWEEEKAGWERMYLQQCRTGFATAVVGVAGYNDGRCHATRLCLAAQWFEGCSSAAVRPRRLVVRWLQQHREVACSALVAMGARGRRLLVREERENAKGNGNM